METGTTMKMCIGVERSNRTGGTTITVDVVRLMRAEISNRLRMSGITMIGINGITLYL